MVALLILPYYLFEGRLFIGGDDSRLLYAFPWEFMQNVSFSSWFKFSSVGFNNPNQFLLPLLALMHLLSFLIPSIVILSYLAFSLPLILGFIYFQRLLGEIIQSTNHRAEILLGSLLFVLSPITIVNQISVFLYAAWLIGVLPILSFYFIRYLKTGNFRYVLLSVLWSTLLSLALFSVPWLLGFIFPLIIGLLLSLAFYKKAEILHFLKKGVLFFGVLALSQCYWLLPFAGMFYGSPSNGLGNQVADDTFEPTVLATSQGTVFYPLINLFHRQIAFDFNWQLKEVFLSFYDYLALFNLLFLIVLFAGIFFYKSRLSLNEKRSFLIFLFALIVSLFLFTVNVGVLKELFLWLGNIPGFVMFRNAFDKFALGYIFLYAIVLTFSLVIIRKRLGTYWHITLLASVFVLIILNALPLKSLVNKPLWTTDSSYTSLQLPNEYLSFMSEIKKSITPSSNILSIPFGISSYTIIKEEGTNNVYAGRSPVQIFSGVNDLSGSLSLPSDEGNKIHEWIIERDYQKINAFIKRYNIGYVILTKNIPPEVQNSYLFNHESLKHQDTELIEAITRDQILKSENGNYQLYQTKNSAANVATLGQLYDVKSESYSSFRQNSYDYTAFLDSLTNTDFATVFYSKNSYSSQVVPLFDNLYSFSDTEEDVLKDNFTTDRESQKHRLYKNGATKQLYYERTKEHIRLLAKEQNDIKINGQTATLTNVVKSETLLEVDDIDKDQSYYLDLNNLVVPVTEAGSYYLGPLDQSVNIRLLTSSENTISNPSFESGLWQRNVSDCHNYDNNAEINMSLVDTSSEGEKSLQLEARRHNACINTTFDVEPGNSILNFDYRSSTGNPAGYYLVFNNSTRQVVSERLSLSSNQTKWQKLARQIDVPEDATSATLYVYAYEANGEITSTVGYDNFSFSKSKPIRSIEVPKPAPDFQALDIELTSENNFELSYDDHNDYNLISNSSFEYGPWQRKVSDCNNYDQHSSIAMSLNESYRTEGRQSLQLEAARHIACTSTKITLGSWGSHLLSFDVQGKDTKQAGYHLKFNDSDGTIITEKIPLTYNTQWQKIARKINVPPGANGATLHIYAYESNQRTNNVVHYDNFQFRKIPDIENTYYLLTEPEAKMQSPGKIDFAAVNPTKKRVSVESAQKPFVLSFAETFHPGWKLYLRPIAEKINCKPLKTFKAGTEVGGETVECESKQRAIEGEELSYLRQKPVFDDQHIELNGYANGWIVDPEFVRANYGPEYYSENPDGSIDMNLAIYFKPQSYFYIGLVVSGLTLVGCLSYLLWRTKFRQHRKYAIRPKAKKVGRAK